MTTAAPSAFLNFLSDNGTENPQNQMMAKQLLHSLGKAIEALPEKERIVITLYYYEELNLKEIGECWGLPNHASPSAQPGGHPLKVKMKNLAG
jgi:RNA polymerase sigma factor for flagellar operon FliA